MLQRYQGVHWPLEPLKNPGNPLEVADPWEYPWKKKVVPLEPLKIPAKSQLFTITKF